MTDERREQFYDGLLSDGDADCTLPCGCVLQSHSRVDGTLIGPDGETPDASEGTILIYCPMHAAASDTLAACKAILAIYYKPAAVPIDALGMLAAAIRKGDPSESGCPTCGATHPPCSQCGAPTRCPPDELGEPFSMCDDCDHELSKTG